MRGHSLARVRRVACGMRAAMLLLAATACYSYAPVDSQAPAPAGGYVALSITDRGRVGLNERFGEGVREISGRVVEQNANDLVLSVDHVRNLEGETTRWAGEETRVNRDYVGFITQRRFSAARTSLVAVGVGAAIYAMAVNGLIGGGQDVQNDDDPNAGKASNRVPRRPGLSHDIRVPLWRIWVR
jgi:hypothetical protein